MPQSLQSIHYHQGNSPSQPLANNNLHVLEHTNVPGTCKRHYLIISSTAKAESWFLNSLLYLRISLPLQYEFNCCLLIVAMENS